MPRKPKPTKLKLIDGNPGKRPINMDEPEPKRRVPFMPKWLKEYPVAVKEWKREVRILDDMGIMTVADEGNLSFRCFLASEVQRLALEGRVNDPNKELTKLKNLVTEYRQLGSLLGLDAPSRTKFKSNNPKRKSKVQAFRDRKSGEKS